MADKRYYWLKLKEDFFQDEAIEWLEEQENGKEYCLFYLKLCLKSLKDDGKLIRTVGNLLIPYSTEKLAEATRTKADTVMVAMQVLQRIGLVEILDDGAIKMLKLQDMVGSEAGNANALRQKRFRQRKKQELLLQGVTNSNALCNAELSQGVTNSNALCNAELSQGVTNNNALCNAELSQGVTNNNAEIRDKSIEYRDKSKEIRESNLIVIWEQNISPITPVIAEELERLKKDYGLPIVLEAIKVACKRGKRNIAYVGGVARNMFTEGWSEEKQQKPKQEYKNPFDAAFGGESSGDDNKE